MRIREEKRAEKKVEMTRDIEKKETEK